jgi:putative glycosyltransferase
VVYVDDGSRDQSLEILLGFQQRDPHVVVAELSRNWGDGKREITIPPMILR